MNISRCTLPFILRRTIINRRTEKNARDMECVNPTRNGGKITTTKMAVLKRDTAFNELFISPIQELYSDQVISIEDFKDRNATLLTNRCIDTRHGLNGEKIYELYDAETEGEIVKESLQEWLCDN